MFSFLVFFRGWVLFCLFTLHDFTVASTHAVSNHALAVKDKYASGLADYGAHLKDQKHSRYLTEGNAIGFAFDSMGGISESAMKFINHLYARGRGNRKHNWDSESMRLALRKEFLDRLSMVLCFNRVYKFLSQHHFHLFTCYHICQLPHPL